eukprot:CAMPEP_0173417794 /NCGR_PEP_ID=MMETSP1357-20121228/37_1 /TAXON_ID=77926 /ORGANISM="Hemiselmis rufescens, Strain PCC563" /LENGTH=140 /DNA_ID=CAMNT_0014380143 /DNA_START=75 /DNA_END=494 /DNA_ORIENTATION=+
MHDASPKATSTPIPMARRELDKTKAADLFDWVTQLRKGPDVGGSPLQDPFPEDCPLNGSSSSLTSSIHSLSLQEEDEEDSRDRIERARRVSVCDMRDAESPEIYAEYVQRRLRNSRRSSTRTSRCSSVCTDQSMFELETD